MTRLIAALYPLFIAFSALAEDIKDAPIPEHTDVLGITIFFVLFIGLCVGFIAYMWWRNKHGKEE